MLKLIQLTLDLFDPAPPQAAPAPTAPPPAPEPPQPLRAAAPAEPLDAVLAPATFHHPRANRQATLGHTFVAYELRRAKRRNIGFVVGPEGLTVSAPKWVPLYEVDAAVRSKSAWILSKLESARQRQDRIESARIQWKEGAVIPFLGEQVIVVLDPRRGGAAELNAGGEALPGVPRLTLHVGLPHHATAEQIRDAVQAWLMRQAKRVFTERLEHYAPKLSVQWRKLVLSNAGTRWGTAHSDGTIRLNWRLIHFRLPVIDYVVAHELSHLRVMDHSPRFWDTVATVVPDYAQLRGQLRDEALPPW
ncbi:M48 family peptidase [Ramlibacter henchirensis]|uniref:M48 family peptidase n=1 Tax=Ramlibacter henchirensis TaxID=204072 RepID=A0A4Z0C5S4_9BURK|nr:SprT family zinc-dependent metalloprotease [Ramlibacter henchirensis]TFZ07117.1 M48 family peptidase [Ramlibacter henchirensis]